ncbi:centrosomal protein of 70 kDa [Lampris incognitus]|uniref:centrosomal protein of 70 kDa n=1 Tax=Lampris incognitus TaxID=2546036 RepID=UPI0024B565E6|nr:centrosomal protein of 70 kDa [Lampris incognitus]
MEQLEQTEWDCVNKLLQHHGFKPVHFADPVENKNLSDLVLLDKRAAAEIRSTFRTMLTDSGRRQALIQEFIQSNKQLKEEARVQMSRAACQSQRATELEGLLDGVKRKVQELEDKYLSKAAQQHGKAYQLQQEKEDAQKQCQALEQKLSKERKAMAQVQKKLHFAVKEKERRMAQQTRMFQQIYKRTARQHSPVDQQVLDVIDFYETQIAQLHDELKSLKGDSEVCDPTSCSRVSSVITPAFKTILESYQEQLKESKSQREELKSEVQRLKQDLETRPTLKELKSYKHQLRCMERLNKQNNKNWPKEDNKTQASHSEVENVRQQVMEADSCAQHRHLLNEVRAILTGPRAPLRLHRQRPAGSDMEGSEYRAVLPTLNSWSEQLNSLKELHHALSKLSMRLMPWQPSNNDQNLPESVRVEDLMLLVDTMLEDTSIDDERILRSPTRYTLESMVSHFQKLFDVHSLSGVFPRMNEVYTRLGEMTNAMRNLRDILDLDDRGSPGEVVNQVARVVSSTEDSVVMQLRKLLAEGDIDSVIHKLKEHNEFFPAFHSVVLELMETLGVSVLDDILPALRLLKLRTQ